MKNVRELGTSARSSNKNAHLVADRDGTFEMNHPVYDEA